MRGESHRVTCDINTDGPPTVHSVDCYSANVARHHRAGKLLTTAVYPGVSKFPLLQQHAITLPDCFSNCARQPGVTGGSGEDGQ